MIIDRAHRLAEQIANLESARRSLDRLEALTTRRDMAKRLLERVRPLVAAKRELEAAGIHVAVNDDLIRIALEKLQELRQAVKSAGEAAIPTARFNAVATPIERLIPEFESAVTSAWTTYVTSRIPPVDQQVLGVLRRLPGFQQSVRRIETSLSLMQAAMVTPPQNAEALAAFNERVTAVEDAWHSLGGQSVPPAVLQFLKDAGSQGATLEQLSNEVRGWLEAHHLFARVRVHLLRDAISFGSK